MLTIKVDDTEVGQLLKGLKNKIGDIPWMAIGQWGVNTIQGNFDAGGRPDSWPDKKDGTPCFLIDTGALQQSVNFSVGKNRVTIDSGLSYGVWHIQGTSRLPVRDYMVFPPESFTELDDLLDKHWDDLE